MLSWGLEYKFENFLGREIILFHDFLMGVLVFLGVFVGGLLYYTFKNHILSNSFIEGHTLETVWTLFPLVVVVLIFYPSLHLLNSSKNFFFGKENIVKIIGHQWYWEYRYLLGEEVMNYDSYPVSVVDNVLEEGKIKRNLEVSSIVLFNRKSKNEIKVTSTDVIHRFCLPNVGIKLDAVPGRVKTSVINNLVKKSRVISGQCSEICGVYHGNMPILALFLG